MMNGISLHNVLNYTMTDLEKYKFVATICRIEKARAKLDEKSSLFSKVTEIRWIILDALFSQKSSTGH
nr:hypothetical protein [Mycoplasmopsis bovis]